MPKTPVYIAHSRDNRFSATRIPADLPDVTAAGCLPWRYKNNQLQVLIIHRPKYDDWSWPKGKHDDGETIAETAVREVREEVNLNIALGVPLAVTEYKVKKKTKHVYYWAAEVAPGVNARADEGEVDELRWVTPQQAHQLLTNASDRQPLTRLEELFSQGELATRAIVIIRHAQAKPRSSWGAAEGERPLTATGKQQALQVCSMLTAWEPQKIYSSPWLRCMHTITSYTKATGVPIKEKPALTEDAHERHPQKVAKIVDSLFDKEYNLALCTHRPVLPTVLEVLSKHANKHLLAGFPSKAPYLAPGEMLVLQVSKAHKNRVISLEQIKPFGS